MSGESAPPEGAVQHKNLGYGSNSKIRDSQGAKGEFSVPYNCWKMSLRRAMYWQSPSDAADIEKHDLTPCMYL